ncbi:hypothetical protein AB6D04_07030 [Vibrio splendidus]|uniref:hypothetical protein n=1 Tax=Vibrio splendidus TaxID=29497 RepID=UPI001055AB96|nr:hypothetical protein [Vibrio splendidus]
MTTDFKNAAKALTDDEIKEALENYLENNGGDEAESGIVRQLLGEEQKPLSSKQQYIFENEIEPCLVEKCGMQSCKKFVPSGRDYCPTCEIEYG